MGKNRYYCRINGIVHNLSDVQECIDQKKFDGEITLALYENHGMSSVDAWVFEDVLKFRDYDIPADYNEALKEMQDYNQAQIRMKQVSCPYCHSTDVEEYSFSPFTWSAPEKFWRCKNCKCEFGHHY